MAPCASVSSGAATETKKKGKAAHLVKAAPAVEVESKDPPSIAGQTPTPSDTSASPAAPVVAAPSFAVAPQNLTGTLPPPAPQSQSSQLSVYALLSQMRAQVAADAANKDRLLRQAMAAEQQRSAMQNSSLLAQTTNSSPLEVLENVLSSIVSGGQQISSPDPQLVALVAALSGGARVPSIVQPQPQQTVPTASLLQLLTPAQQLELLNQIASSKTPGPNPQV